MRSNPIPGGDSASAFEDINGLIFPIYRGDDLGLSIIEKSISLRLWSPQAQGAQLLVFEEAEGGYPKDVIDMRKDSAGTWVVSLPPSYLGLHYTYRVRIKGEWSLDVPDPYAKLSGVNGNRSFIGDLSGTDPDGWKADQPPATPGYGSPADAIIYELHVRDLGMHPSSGITHKGKFLSLTETNTRNTSGLTTGISHIGELGITHVHLLPVNDFHSVNEALPFPGAYNWGYDPLNYFLPEGSYSSNPFDPATRVTELKKAVMAMHKQGLRVVADVVFNHTGYIRKSAFHQLVPGYYYRYHPDGQFSDASGCGNETASERYMFRKYMIDCLLFWMKEYHIDGFRFDLMGIHDVETMKIVADACRQTRPDILLYGEGWAGGDSLMPHHLRAVKENVHQLNGIAVFSDDIRDAIKGKVFHAGEKGFIGGAHHLEQTIRAGIVASCLHPQVHFLDSDQPGKPFATHPTEVVSYCECHDNHTLWDRLAITNPEDSEEDRKKMHRLALAIILTSQGIPFLHAGTEFLRSKQGVENSYRHPDSINAINWDEKTVHQDLTNDIITLIHIRKNHPAFRLRTGEQIRGCIHFDEQCRGGTIAYSMDGAQVGDSWKKIWIGMNAHKEKRKFHLPPGEWKQAFPEQKKAKSVSGNHYINGISLEIFYQD